MKNRSSIYTVAILIAGYICFQLVADVSTAKIITIAGHSMPAGTLVFALTFTWRDMIHKKLGKEWARAAIVTAALANIFMALYFSFAAELPGAVFWGGQEAWESILGIVPRIVIASIIAEFISEMVDTEVYHYAMSRISERHQWGRVLASNAVSLPLDSLIFTMLAFYGTGQQSHIGEMIIAQVLFKALVTVISLPLIYTVKEQPIEKVETFGVAD
jgi:uncharacterized integral membrane protein (TIGR00697 family)